MPASRAVFLDKRRQELFAKLRESYDDLTDAQDVHNATPFGCVRSGKCCQVGLQVHLMECESIATNIRQMCGDDEDMLEEWVSRLERAFEDEAWTWAESVGDHMCAFFEDGCSIYPFRPAVCRAYGVVIGVDEFCPRKRVSLEDLSEAEPDDDDAVDFVFAQKHTDRMMAHFYRTLDTYGRLHPKHDFTVYMPAGVLSFLLPPERLKALKARTPAKFWRRQKGYRMQFEPSYKMGKARQTNVRFPSLEKYMAKSR